MAAVLLAATLPVAAEMVPTPRKTPSERVADVLRSLGEEGRRAADGLDADPQQLHAGANVLTTIQLVMIGALVLTAIVMLIAIIGYGLFSDDEDSGEDHPQFDDFP